MEDDWQNPYLETDEWEGVAEVVSEQTLLSKREAWVYLYVTDGELGGKGATNPPLTKVFERVGESLSIEPSTVATYWERANAKEDKARCEKKTAENTITFFGDPMETAIDMMENGAG